MGKQSRHFGLAVLLAAVLLLPFVMVGCSKRDKGQWVTFAVGGAPAEFDVWQRIVDDFQQQRTIRVELLRQPSDTAVRRQGLMTALNARQSSPDVFLLDVAWLGQFAASGWLEPLDDYMAVGEPGRDVFFQHILERVDMYHDQLIALPVYIDAGVLYYRKDLLAAHGIDNPPDTWQQLLDNAIQIQQAQRQAGEAFYGFVWQGAQYEGLVCNWLEVAVAHGGGVIRDNRVIVNSPANLAATELMHDFIHRYHISPAHTYIEMKEEQSRRYFQEGKALFQRNWPYAWALHQQEDSPIRGKIGIAPLPGTAQGPAAATLGGWHIGMSVHSEMKPETFEFIRYILSYEVQKRLALELGWNPGRRDIYDDEQVRKEMPHLSALRAVFETAHPRPTVPYYTMISDILQRRINAALSGQTPPDRALRQAHKEIEAIVKHYED